MPQVTLYFGHTVFVKILIKKKKKIVKWTNNVACSHSTLKNTLIKPVRNRLCDQQVFLL